MTTNTNQNTPRSLELRSKLDQLKAERSNRDNLPSKAPIEAAIARLTSQHALHPEKWRSSLEAAVAELTTLEEQYARRTRLNTDISNTQVELDLELGAIHAAQREDVIRRYGEIAAAYKHNCLQAAKSHRELLSYCQQHGLQLPPRMEQFNIPLLMGHGWQGTLGEAMRLGAVPFEQNDRNEKEAA